MRGVCLFFLALGAMGASAQADTASLSYFGRSSVKIKTASGVIIYIDPFAPGDYSEPADILLVTHGHADHNKVSLVSLKEGALVAAPRGALRLKTYRETKEGDAFNASGLLIRALPAYNKNHPRASSLGYLIVFDGLSLYHAGDTSFIPEMSALAKAKVDYALFPVDGFFNMGGEEAGRCADAVRPRVCVAIHSSPQGLYDEARAAALDRPNALRPKPGETLELR